MTSCYHQEYVRTEKNVSYTKSFVLKTAGEINSERNCAWLVYIQLVTKNHPIATILLKNNYFYVEAKDIS